MEKEYGNFIFLKKIQPEIYEKLALAERVARTDFRKSGHETREALEKFVKSLIENLNLRNYIPEHLELNKKIECLRDEVLLKTAGCLKPIFPNLGKIKYRQENERIEEIDYYDFIRKFGNSCSHAETRTTDVKVNYEHVIKCLKGYHLLMKRYYSNRISSDTPAFDEDRMPIEAYQIYDAYIPTDSIRSKCIKEFLGYIADSKGDKAFYAILRLYNKADLNERFIHRNTDTFIEASKLSMSSVPEGMTSTRELIPYQDSTSTFYIISYVFNREPIKMTETILSNMGFGKRIKLCKRLADCFYNLHKSEIPIYHRMVSYESVYLCDYGTEWVPYVIKFDFAKIDSGDVARTVFDDAVKAKDRVSELKQKKYLAPEWVTTSSSADANWEKMDIFSLGVLFGDILVGKIETCVADMSALEELDLSEDLLDMLDKMRADMPQERCDMEEVQMILEEEAKRWR